jgi:hypothetical protein
MQNKLVRIGPLQLLAALGTDIITLPTVSGGTNVSAPGLVLILKHIRIVNRSAGAATFSLWLGASGANVAGTEVIGQGLSVAANSAFDWYGLLRIEGAEALVGGAGTANALTFQAEGELGVL